MDWQQGFALCSFAFVGSATPGPNNLMLLASGANYGFRRTLPHMVGISAGMALLLVLVLLGLGELFERYQLFQPILRTAGVVYLLWLAYKIYSTPVASYDAQEADTGGASPFSWWQAVLFQFVNPKAWLLSITAVSAFTLAGESYFASGVMMILVFVMINFPSIAIWAGLGSYVRRWLSAPQSQRIFNRLMAALTAATVVLIL